jgi:hypothetical protein
VVAEGSETAVPPPGPSPARELALGRVRRRRAAPRAVPIAMAGSAGAAGHGGPTPQAQVPPRFLQPRAAMPMGGFVVRFDPVRDSLGFDS